MDGTGLALGEADPESSELSDIRARFAGALNSVPRHLYMLPRTFLGSGSKLPGKLGHGNT